MPVLKIENLGKKYINGFVWETSFGKIHLKKINFCLRLKQINVSRYGESALKLSFKMLQRNVLIQISRSRNFLDHF